MKLLKETVTSTFHEVTCECRQLRASYGFCMYTPTYVVSYSDWRKGTADHDHRHLPRCQSMPAGGPSEQLRGDSAFPRNGASFTRRYGNNQYSGGRSLPGGGPVWDRAADSQRRRPPASTGERRPARSRPIHPGDGNRWSGRGAGSLRLEGLTRYRLVGERRYLVVRERRYWFVGERRYLVVRERGDT